MLCAAIFLASDSRFHQGTPSDISVAGVAPPAAVWTVRGGPRRPAAATGGGGRQASGAAVFSAGWRHPCRAAPSPPPQPAPQSAARPLVVVCARCPGGGRRTNSPRAGPMPAKGARGGAGLFSLGVLCGAPVWHVTGRAGHPRCCHRGGAAHSTGGCSRWLADTWGNAEGSSWQRQGASMLQGGSTLPGSWQSGHHTAAGGGASPRGAAAVDPATGAGDGSGGRRGAAGVVATVILLVTVPFLPETQHPSAFLLRGGRRWGVPGAPLSRWDSPSGRYTLADVLTPFAAKG